MRSHLKFLFERRYFFGWLLCMAMGLPLLAGCGGPDDQPELGMVSGTVTKDGEPLADAWIEFHPDTGRLAAGRTNAEGKYTLQYTNEAAGAKVGTHTVKIGTGSAQQSREAMRKQYTGDRNDIAAAGGGRQQFFERTGVTVSAGENVIDFEVTENNTYKPPVANPRGRGRRGR